MSVNWDLDRDGELDTSTTGSWSVEEQAIIDAADYADCDRMVFYTGTPDQNWLGSAPKGSKFLFVYPEKAASPSDVHLTTAHEIGHAAFNFDDLEEPDSDDEENLMWNQRILGVEQGRLRYWQWKKIQVW